MTYQPNCTLPKELLEQIAADGFDVLPELIQVLIDEAMRLEREKHLGAGPYERTPERRGVRSLGSARSLRGRRIGRATGLCPHRTRCSRQRCVRRS